MLTATHAESITSAMASLRKPVAPASGSSSSHEHPGSTEGLNMSHRVPFTSDDIKSFAVAVLYVSVSAGMTFFNKAVLSHYKFDYEMTILFIQLIVSIVVLQFMSRTGVIPPLDDLTVERAKKMLVVSLLYSANVAIALSALANLNIPMYTTLKKLSVCFALLGELIILGKSPSLAISFSVITIAAGAIVAGFGDLEFSAFGYLLGIASCLSQTGYLMFVVKREKESGMSTFGLFYANCVLSLPFVFIVSILTGDLSDALAYPDLLTPSFIAVLLLSSLLGALLNYSIFLCAVVNSPLTLLVSGQFKSIVTVGIGIFTFGGVTLNFLNVFGWVLNTVGSLGYAWLKYEEKHGDSKSSQSASENNAKLDNSKPQNKQEV